MKKLFFITWLVIIGLSANAQWKQTSLNSGYVYSFAIKGDSIFAGTHDGIFLSSNGGSSWAAMDAGLTGNALIVGALSVYKNKLFAGTDTCMYSSSNNGSSWSASGTGLTGIAIYVDAFALNSDTIIAGTGGGVYLSSNNGASWHAVNNGLYDSTWVGTLAIKEDTVFAGTYDSGLYVSANNGHHWIKANTGLAFNLGVWAIAISGNNIIAASDSGAYLSHNNGSSWTAVNTGLPSSYDDINTLLSSGNNIFAGTGDGVYWTNNNGNSWTAVNTGLSYGNGIGALAVKEDTLFAGTYTEGIWKRAISEIAGIKELNNNACNIVVYPNPATNNLTIESLQNTTIEITNMQGQLVETIVTKGNKTNIDVSALASGVYVVQARTKNGVGVKKFVKE
ncbi:MAG: T9SS type A sorting domain-containing protein [Bacteroidales bacterium]|jgi:hypothetical protein